MLVASGVLVVLADVSSPAVLFIQRSLEQVEPLVGALPVNLYRLHQSNQGTRGNEQTKAELDPLWLAQWATRQEAEGS